jgi:hypothetical protein
VQIEAGMPGLYWQDPPAATLALPTGRPTATLRA